MAKKKENHQIVRDQYCRFRLLYCVLLQKYTLELSNQETQYTRTPGVPGVS